MEKTAMTPEIINRDKFIVLGIRMVMEIGSEEIDALWRDRFLPRHSEIKAIENGYYGVFNFLPGDFGGRVEYVAGAAADSLEDIPDGMVGWVVPDGDYAEIVVTGRANIAKACREIMTEWLPDSGYQKVASPMFAYTSDMHPDSPEAVWKVNVPVETHEEVSKYETWLGENPFKNLSE